MIAVRRVAVAAGLVAVLGLGASAGEAAPEQLRGAALVEALRVGGYVVYFRHAATDFTMTDTGLASCRTQRNLDARGRADARAIGRAWRALRLPVGRVLASRYCRARDTARLAFGRFTLSTDITGLLSAATPAEERRRVRALRRLLAQRPARANTVLVAHLFNIQEAAAISLEEGEAAVFQPLGAGGFRLVAKVLPRSWPTRAFAATAPAFTVREYRVPPGTHPHDVAPAPDGSVWYTAQHTGALGTLDPKTGRTRHIPLGDGSAPHGVIVGPDGAPWITDGGLNAIVRVDPKTEAVRVFRLPASTGYANLNTATFDRKGVLWFTGQSGVYGRVTPSTGRVQVFRAPRGTGPYGITTTPGGAVYYASLAGSYLGRINTTTGRATVLQPPTRGQGARRAWSDSRGRIWISEWNAGKLGRYDPRTRRWREWRLPGSSPQPYAVYVDNRDIVWLTDFGSNAIVALRPEDVALPHGPAADPGRRRPAAARPAWRALGRRVRRRQARRRAKQLAGLGSGHAGADTHRVTRMPRSPQWWVALAGMAAVTLLAGGLLLLCWLTLTGAYENLELDDLARGEMLASFATIAGTGALACILGLGLRRRLVTAVGAVTVLACAAAGPLLTRGWGVLGEDAADAVVVASVGVAAAGLLAVWAACTPSSAGLALGAEGHTIERDSSREGEAHVRANRARTERRA